MHSAPTSAALAGPGEPPPKSQPRVRLDLDARRAQLLELGRELFASHGYDDLSIGDIARAAGISKGLLYHYFPNKRAFYIESLREAAEELLRHTLPPRNLAPLERLRAGIDGYLAYVDRHRPLFASSSWRGFMQDSEVNHIVQNARLEFFDRLLTEAAPSPIGRHALRGFIGFVETSVLDWIERTDVTPRELSDLFVAVFQEIVLRTATTR
jgi:AcrR family transcriptional regulator